MLKEDFSGLEGESLSRVIVVVSEYNVLEVLNFFEYFSPEFTEVAAVRRENAVAFLIESEPVKDALSEDESIVFFAGEGVEAERSVSEEGVVGERRIFVFRSVFIFTVSRPVVTPCNVVENFLACFIPEWEKDTEIVLRLVNADFELSDGVIRNAARVKVIESLDV